MDRLRYILPLAVVGLVMFLGWLGLRQYTRHGELNIVPDLSGMPMTEAVAALSDRDMIPVVVDSVHNAKAVKGAVLDQDPMAGAEVKPGRKVYLVLNAQQPPMIDMPDLVDLSKRQALSVMEILGLNVGSMEYRPDPCVDCVIEQQVDGQRIAPGTRVRRGSVVVLVLGSGDQGQRVPVPDLIGLTLSEVGEVLHMASLNTGVIVDCAGCNTASDSAFAQVMRQSPQASVNDLIALGGSIDIWLTTDTIGLARVGDPNVIEATTGDDPSDSDQ